MHDHDEQRKPLYRLEDIADGGAAAVEVESSTGGFSLVLLRQGEKVFAYHNECPHAGRRLDWSPGKFLVKDGVIICAAHGATFGSASLNQGAVLIAAPGLYAARAFQVRKSVLVITGR